MTQPHKGHGAGFFAIAIGIIFLGILAAGIALELQWQSFVISDVRKSSDVAMHARFGGEVTWLQVHIIGKIDGQATLWEETWGRQQISGEVNYKLNQDWYSSDCVLHYEPQDVSAGTLTIRYKFE